jgi:D-alanyl-D-alanine carboxypeptidase (penicillin-binding protein 5/6)
MRGWLAAALLSAAAAHAAPAADLFPGVASAYLVDVNGEARWEANADRRLPPASLAKLMTALLIAEHGRGEEFVSVSATAAAATGARLGLRPGERMRVDALLAALLIRSANDACRALAQWQAGSEAAFVARMNHRAVELGLADTAFTNACGHDGPGTYSTARDLAVLARRVLANDVLSALVARERQDVRTQDGRTFHLATTNALLGRVPGVRGVKTGYTPEAGTCIVAYAEREGRQVQVVLLHARDRWWDAAAMIERAFDAVPPAGRTR